MDSGQASLCLVLSSTDLSSAHPGLAKHRGLYVLASDSVTSDDNNDTGQGKEEGGENCIKVKNLSCRLMLIRANY